MSSGYNGAPAGLRHCIDMGCIRNEKKIPSGEKQEYCRGVHAEQNALIQAEDRDKLNGATLYCTHTPCLMCVKMILNAKIKRVVHGGQYPVIDLAQGLINESGVIFEEYEIGLTKEEIDKALAKGKEEADAYLAHTGNLPGHYKS
jgi:dCMP deaminase